MKRTTKLSLGFACLFLGGAAIYVSGIAGDHSKLPYYSGCDMVETEPAIAPGSREALEIEAARSRLEILATASSIDIRRLRGRLDEFEARQRLGQIDKDQIVETYDTLSEVLMGTTAASHYDKAQRAALVELTVHNLARPCSIDQGNHPTCNVTTLEVYMSARHPEVYADMVKQVSLTGKYTNHAGETMTPPKAALMPGSDEKSFDIDVPSANKRNLASQLVQMTMINGVYETGRYHVIKDARGNPVDCSDRRYVLKPDHKRYFWTPYGKAFTIEEDMLLDGNGRKISDGPDLIGDDVLAASEMVLGYEMPYLDSPYKIQGQPWVYDCPTKERLLKLKADGKLPLGVPTAGGTHVQTIHDVVVENGTCWVLIDNQRGEKEDGWITLDTLHRTMKSNNFKFTPSKTRSK